MSWPPFGRIVGPALGSSRNKHEPTSQAEEKASGNCLRWHCSKMQCTTSEGIRAAQGYAGCCED